MKKNIKIALVHDFLTEYGGAERVLETLVEMYPSVKVYTSYFDKTKFGKDGIYLTETEIEGSIFQNIPMFSKILSPMRIFAPWVFMKFDLSTYDVVISSTNTYFAKAVNFNGIHICYCHTPPRYLYGYPTARNWKKSFAGRIVGEFMNFWLRQVDFKISQKPTVMIANSKEVQRRIKKFYRRDSIVVYPPIDTQRAQKPQKGEYYLVVSRLARAKRVDLAIRAAKKLNTNLLIVGSGIEMENLKQIAGGKTKFLGFVPDDQLWSIYSKAKAFIFSAEEEDFGMTAVEAMAAGKPVIALNQGGVKESVIDGETGVFFDEATVESLVNAIKKFEKMKFDTNKILKQSKEFSKEKFEKGIKAVIEKYA